ncbi:unnamed protein product, partial [Polarella glacialis]
VTNTSPSYRTSNWSLEEFVQHDTEDWMVVADYQGPGVRGGAPEVPEALLRLAWESDRWRRKSEEDSVRTSEWATFAQHARETFLRCGIQATPWLS